MKKALSIACFSAGFGPINYVATDARSFGEVCRKVRRMGYDGIDLFINEKSPEDVREIKMILDDTGLSVSMAIFIELSKKGVNLSHRDERARHASLETYTRELDTAMTLGALAVPLGYIRGALSPDDLEEDYLPRLADSTRSLSREATQRSLRLCVEPINRYEINTLPDVPSALDFLTKYELAEAWLLPDLFHMNIEDASITESLREAGPRIGHMHVADSNRLAPGLGHINYQDVLGVLREIGYSQFLSAEMMNGGDPDASASQALSYLSRMDV